MQRIENSPKAEDSIAEYVSELSEDCNFKTPYKKQVAWKGVFMVTLLHVMGIVGLLYFSTLKLALFAIAYGYVCSLGVTAGTHRLWSHRTYKAKLPLRIFLMLMNSAMVQGNIYVWSRDHRVHHKYTDTDADPYNAKRGFFFSHVGWLLLKKHPDVIEKGNAIDCSDILADPVVKFQIKYYYRLVFLFGAIIPTLISYYAWDFGLFQCLCVCFYMRCLLTSHFVWLVNSAAHKWGYKPYNAKSTSTENVIVSLLASGEGFHNYHHAFPWDYSTSEFGWRFNVTTMFIDSMAWLGLAYDLKKTPDEVIEKYKKKYIKPVKES